MLCSGTYIFLEHRLTATRLALLYLKLQKLYFKSTKNCRVFCIGGQLLSIDEDN